MIKQSGMVISVAVYMAAILLVNWLFAPSQLVEGVTFWPTRFGDVYLANFIVGFIFVLRDYAQREIGQRILLVTGLAGVLVYFMVGPSLALASITAFILSETVDWGVYTLSKRPLQKRIILSSLVAVPVDTFAFQYLAGYLTPAAFTMEILSKALGVMLLWFVLKWRIGSGDERAHNNHRVAR